MNENRIEAREIIGDFGFTYYFLFYIWYKKEKNTQAKLGECMRISWIKNKKDMESFEWIKSFGGKVYELEEPEQVDQVIKELCDQQHCKTIILSNELAGFSEDIIKKYKKDEQIRIVIAPKKSD